jgi:hypothetical protein
MILASPQLQLTPLLSILELCLVFEKLDDLG